MLNEPEDQGSSVEHVYGSVILDTKDVRAYNNLDDKHCILRTYNNDSYCIALGLEDLKQVMVELTGENITVIRKIDLKDKSVRDVEDFDDVDPDDDFLL